MKKSFFGFSAKVAMAVLAVCSFVLTSCYEKSPVAKTPSEYHVVGSVYDAETGKVITEAKVTLDGKSVSSTFNMKLSSYVPSVTVTLSKLTFDISIPDTFNVSDMEIESGVPFSESIYTV